MEGRLHGPDVVVHVAAEIGRVVAVQRDFDALCQELAKGVIGHGLEYTQADVGERADGQRHAFAHQTRDQSGVLQRPHAVIDARRPQQVEGLADIFRRTFLAGMGNDRLAEGAAAGEDAFELAGRIALFRRIEPEAVDPRQMRLGFGQRGKGVFLAEMTQEAEDQPAADAPARLALLEALFQTVEHGQERNAARRMGLRVEEDFGMNDVVGGGAFEIGQHQIAEIVGAAQHVGTGVIEIEKGLQAVEVVGGGQRGFVGVRQRDAVAAGERKGQRRLQRAFDMHVQLGLRHAAGQCEDGIRVLRGGHGRSSPVIESVARRAGFEHPRCKGAAPPIDKVGPRGNEKRDPQVALRSLRDAHLGIEP